ncbi:MAG TPA: cytochrome c oxidase subunit 4 [Acidimicrobiales bacterium]|nr:cytochrome c oxidase subunit 4 [Acidimicrobiales bacterium]
MSNVPPEGTIPEDKAFTRRRRAWIVEARFLVGVAVFFAAVCAMYWFGSYENAGTVLLVFTAFLGLLPGGYLLWWSRRMRPRPEDRDDAVLDEGAGHIGAFPDSSIWPFIFGIGAGVLASGFVFGAWLWVLGVSMIISAIVGVVIESRRGGTV